MEVDSRAEGRCSRQRVDMSGQEKVARAMFDFGSLRGYRTHIGTIAACVVQGNSKFIHPMPPRSESSFIQSTSTMVLSLVSFGVILVRDHELPAAGRPEHILRKGLEGLRQKA